MQDFYTTAPVRVLFVCLGNICRSPAAEVIFTAAAQQVGIADRVKIDSCGTAGYHIGQKPDRRMLAALEECGYTYGGHRARQFRRADFTDFDLIIPQDESNRSDILALARHAEDAAKVIPMSRWFPQGETLTEVPDPYYGGKAGFLRVIDLLAESAELLAADLKARLR